MPGCEMLTFVWQREVQSSHGLCCIFLHDSKSSGDDKGEVKDNMRKKRRKEGRDIEPQPYCWRLPINVGPAAISA